MLCNLLPLYNVFCLCYNHITVMYKLGFCFTYVQNVHLDVTRKKKCHFRCLILFSCSVMHVVENCPSPMTAGALKSGEKLYEEKYVKKLENYVFHHPFFFFINIPSTFFPHEMQNSTAYCPSHFPCPMHASISCYLHVLTTKLSTNSNA